MKFLNTLRLIAGLPLVLVGTVIAEIGSLIVGGDSPFKITFEKVNRS